MLYHRVCSSSHPVPVVFSTVLEWVLPVAALVLSASFLVGDSYDPFLSLQF